MTPRFSSRQRLFPTAAPLARAVAAVLLLLAVQGCDLSGPDYEEQIVVSAILEVGQPLRAVTLSRTTALGGTSGATPPVTDASITISLLDASGAPEAVYAYAHVGAGRYVTDDTTTLALPGRTYTFAADVPGRPLITARTTTPEAVILAEDVAPQVTYLQGFNGLGPSFRVRSGAAASGDQNVFLIGISADAIDEYEIYQRDDETFGLRRQFLDGRFGPTADAASFIDGIDCEPLAGGAYDCDFLPEDIAGGESPLLNEESYIRNGDGTLTVIVPWLAVSFYGPHTFTLNSLDPALVAFISTQSIQFNPTTISPGEIPNVTTNIENDSGLGVFGSFARTAVTTTIVP